jgi:hypothetical protein
MLLQPDLPGLLGAVMGAGQQGGEGDHVQLVGAAVKSVQILGGGGAGGLRSALAFLHPPQQLRLVKGGVIHDNLVPPRMVRGTLL